MTKKKKVSPPTEVTLLDKVVGYKSQRGRKPSDPSSVMARFRQKLQEILVDAVSRQVYEVPVKAIAGILSREGFFDGVAPEKRYRRSYNYVDQSYDHLPQGWEVKRTGMGIKLVYTDPNFENLQTEE